MNSLLKFLLENGFRILEHDENIIVAIHSKYPSVRINKKPRVYVLRTDAFTFTSRKFTSIRKEILNYVMN